MLDLAGDWSLADGQGGYRLSAVVPGDVHSALLTAALIPDPYFGRNEYALRWVADRDWTFARSFTVEPGVLEPGGGSFTLVADMLDTIAEIRINGQLVAQHATMFRGLAVPVGDALVAGENRIEVTLRSATQAADALQASQPFPVPYHAGNCPIPNGNMLRKPQCDFGWDWNIALAPVGIYGRIALVGPEGALGDATIRQHHADGRVTVEIEVDVIGAAPAETPWTVSLGGVSASGVLAAGESRIRASLDIEAPELWWPNGLGAQPIAALAVTAGALERRWPVALRDIKLVSEPDATGRSFKIVVNGRPVFARGANWIPADALPGRVGAEKTRGLLQSAADANMNMIRVWGGGRYEPADFYESCDALGLLVWQDFMFACHLYPSTDEFLGEVEREVAFQAPRIGHHVALWCGDNELLGALGWFEESRSNRDRYLVAYDRLNRTIETALKRALPGANWWPSSPSPGPLSFGDTWHDDSSGDMHFWSVWHEGRDFEHYRDVTPRFCSEFGFQSYTSMPAIESFAAAADLNVASPVMESHQKNAGGNARIAETMFRYFRFPKDFANFVWLSQVQQGVAIQTAVDYWRSLKPHCMGALYWQLNDTWPVASWSSLDYGGDWKLLHYMAKRFFAPVNVVVIPDAGSFQAVAINDGPEPVSVTVLFYAVSTDGTTRPLQEAEVEVGTDAAAPLIAIEREALGPDEVLAYQWLASGGLSGRDLVAPVRWKALDLQPPGLHVASFVAEDGVRVRVTAEALALFVTLEADRPGRFSANAVHVHPGQDAEILFTPADGVLTDVTFTTRDLFSSAAF